MSSTLQENLQQVESRIMNHPVEMGYAFTSDGGLVLTKEGELRSLPFEDRERAQLKGTVFTHNHPLRIIALGDDESDDHYHFFEIPLRGLSLEDIYFACQVQLAEMRVVDSEYVYSLLPAIDRDTFSPDDIDLIHEAFHFAYDRFSAVWEAAAEVEGFDLEMASEANLYYPVRTLLLAAASVGMAYSVSPLGACALSAALQIEDAELQDAELLD